MSVSSVRSSIATIVEVLGLEAGDDLADEPTLHGIGLEQDQGAIRHGRPRYRRPSSRIWARGAGRESVRDESARRASEGRAGRAGDVERAGGEDGVVAVGARASPGAGVLDGVGHDTSSQPRRARGAADVGAGHAPRRRGGAGDDDVELVGPQRLEHRRRIAQRADDEDRAGRRGRSRRRTPGRRCRRRPGCGRRRRSTSGWWPSTSNRPGIVTSANPSVTTSSRQRRGEERLDRGQRDRRVVALVGAVQRHEHVGVDRRRRADVDEPPADGELVAGGLEVVAAHADRAAAGAAERRRRAPDRSRRSRPPRSGLMIPAFSRAMSASVGPANSVWSMPMFVTTATWASTTLVASHRPSSPTSITATSTAMSANQRNAAAVHASK